MEQVIVEVEAKIKSDLRNQDLATTKDVENNANILRKEIAEAKNNIILWVVGIMATNSVFF